MIDDDALIAIVTSYLFRARIAALTAERDKYQTLAGQGVQIEHKLRGDLLRAEAALRQAHKLLTRIANWDMMAQAADGPYWLREISAALDAAPAALCNACHRPLQIPNDHCSTDDHAAPAAAPTTARTPALPSSELPPPERTPEAR